MSQNPEPRIRRARLVKWDGDPPGPGEHKEPIEVVEIELDGEDVAVIRNGVREERQ